MGTWLEQLNEAQSEAVTHGDGPLLIVAGAGSGKTRVLAYRIAYLLDVQAISPQRILAVTFTNKAAREMRDRVVDLIGPAAQHVWAGTFHATCVRILRQHAHLLGYGRNFLIYDTADQTAAIKQCLKALDIDPKRYEPRGILSAISAAKNELMSPLEFRERATDVWERTVGRAFERYQATLKENQAFDFDDLIGQTVELFRREPEVLAHYQERFRYIMIDEYQDTNRAQYVLVNLLARQHRNLCVVGDPDQSIYRFRGADIRNILDFERDYPDTVVIRLERNYRSTSHILDAANRLIEQNVDRPDKELWTDNPEGDPIFFYRADDERAEAEFVADAMEQARRDDGRAYQDFTLLYRTHAQSRTFEEAFIRRGIPYRIVSGTRFYERKEIKDLLAYLRLILNPADEFSLRRVINVPKRGIGDTTVGRMFDFALGTGLTAYEALVAPGVADALGAAAARRVQVFRELMDNLQGRVGKVSITRLTEDVLQQAGLLRELEQERTVEAEARIENLKEFLSVTRQFEQEQGGDLADFLEHVALVSDVDAYDPDADVATLMTVHAAKGLEFPVVFMVGMEEAVFPHSRSLWESAELEEERRLCYVAMTRTRERLYMTCARFRMMYGTPAANEVSRFVGEIPAELVEDLGAQEQEALTRMRWGSAAADGLALPRAAGLSAGGSGMLGSARQGVAGRSGLSAGRLGGNPGGGGESGSGDHGLSDNGSGETFRAGDRVRHTAWGMGTVVSVESSGTDQMVSIAFAGKGVKKVMAGLAPLEKL